MRDFLRWFLWRANARLAIATAGFLLAEYDLGMLDVDARLALRAVCFATIVATIGRWQDRIGRKVNRGERNHEA